MLDNFKRQEDFNQDFQTGSLLNDLTPIVPYFFVPPLEDKPQNPIIENIRLEDANTKIPPRFFNPPPLPQELMALSLDPPQKEETSYRSIEEFWRHAMVRKLGVHNGLLTWDRLRQSHSKKASSTPFLSEQGELIYAAIRSHVQPRLFGDFPNAIHLTRQELFLSLKSTVIGLSSPLHLWDSVSERFVPAGTVHNAKQEALIIDGKDEVVSNSLIERFLKVGTLLRRLESFLSTFETRSSTDGPTTHSFAHALSTILNYLRETIKKCPPTQEQIRNNEEEIPLLSTLAHYAVYESILEALADLLGRNYASSPKNYITLDLSPAPLLSHIYQHLALHFERHSHVVVRAAIAFLLSITSQEYFRKVARSVGFGGQVMDRGLDLRSERDRPNDSDFDDEEEDIFDLLDKIETSFPAFFPHKLLHVLPAAQKSLMLLRIAQPDHPLLTTPDHYSPIRWIWTTTEIMATWDDLRLPPKSLAAVQTRMFSKISASSLISYEPQLSDLCIFDLEPGDTVAIPSLQLKDDSVVVLERFIEDFPEVLPPITPTLPDLTSLTFKNLVSYSESLSSALLNVIIGSPGILNFRSHLIILRSFLLITHSTFRSRLLNALFSDAGAHEASSTAHSLSVQSVRQKQRRGQVLKENNQPWAVGLSPNLFERETWPPVGSDLSFFLRTVIVDSLESGEEKDGMNKPDPVSKEAGWRLGFAIRDLPLGLGRDKWLDPLCIEALDFLYMDYKPPHPLEILISPDILSKYQRIFTFILRLLRVESALKSLFRMTCRRASINTLFPSLKRSRQLLLYFRFVSQTFVSSLSSYVFDTAIGGNFDPFLDLLSPDPDATIPTDKKAELNDVFELAQRHSTLLDNILSACLLRSGQRGVGDLLRQSLELVLEFAVVVGELYRGRIQEVQATPLIEELFRKFCAKMQTLTKVLKGLVDKNILSSTLSSSLHADGSRRTVGGVEALYHLLIRIDLTDWWSKGSERSERVL